MPDYLLPVIPYLRLRVTMRTEDPAALPDGVYDGTAAGVSYDIPDDRRRTRIAHLLKDFGTRVQYSVFECRLTEERVARLRARVAALVLLEEDNVRLYRLCAECAAHLEIQGLGRTTEDPESYVL